MREGESRMKKSHFGISALLLAAALLLTSCSSGAKAEAPKDLPFVYTAGEGISGEITIVAAELAQPVVQAVSGKYTGVQSGVKVNIRTEGHDQAVDSFVKGTADAMIASADTSKAQDEAIVGTFGEGKVVQLRLATDGIAIVTAKDSALSEITKEELVRIYTAEAIKEDDSILWSDVREGLPKEPVTVLGPEETNDLCVYFKKLILQDKDLNKGFCGYPSMDELIAAVSDDKNAIAFVCLSAALRNSDKVKALPVDFGGGAVEPTIQNSVGSGAIMGAYSEFTYPVYLYVGREAAASKPQLADYLWYLFSDQGVFSLCEEYCLVPMKEQDYVNQISTLFNGR